MVEREDVSEQRERERERERKEEGNKETRETW